MPDVYEIDVDGEIYEVEASTPEKAVEAARGQAYLASRKADVAPRQAHQRTLPGKLARGLSDAPMRAYESGKQLFTAAGEAMGLLDEGATAEQVMDMNMRRLIKTGGDPATEEAADMGEVGLLMVPGAGLMRGAQGAKSIGSLLGRVAGGGAAQGALLLPASETAEGPADVAWERATAAAVSVGIVTPVAAVAALKPAAHNWMKSLKDKAVRNQQTVLENVKAGGWLQGKRGVKTVSQQSGNEIAKSLERQMLATKGQNFLNDQIADQISRWEALNRWVGKGTRMKPGDVSFLTTARRLSDSWKVGEAQAQRAASKLYGDQLSDVVATARTDPSRFPVGFNNLSQATDELAAGSGGRDWWRSLYGPGAESATGPVRQLDDYIKQIRANPGFTQGLDVNEIVILRKNLSQMDSEFYQAIKSSPDVNPELAARHSALRKVIRAVDSDMDATIASAQPGSPAADALHKYRDANKQYEEFKDMQDFMRQTATAQWFGGYQPADAQKFLVKLGGMEPSQQVVLVNTLRNGGEPGKQALYGLRMALVKQAIDQSRMIPAQAASMGGADLNKLGTAMMGDSDVLGSRIFAPAQFAEIKKGLAAIRVLEEAPRASNIARAPNVIGGVMAAGSGSVPFLARLGFQVTGASRIENVLFTKKGLQSLDVVRSLYGSNKAFNPNKVANAIAFLANAGMVAGEMDPEVQAFVEQYGSEELAE